MLRGVTWEGDIQHGPWPLFLMIQSMCGLELDSELEVELELGLGLDLDEGFEFRCATRWTASMTVMRTRGGLF